jgi:hypothetical protein
MTCILDMAGNLLGFEIPNGVTTIHSEQDLLDRRHCELSRRRWNSIQLGGIQSRVSEVGTSIWLPSEGTNSVYPMTA